MGVTIADEKEIVYIVSKANEISKDLVKLKQTYDTANLDDETLKKGLEIFVKAAETVVNSL